MDLVRLQMTCQPEACYLLLRFYLTPMFGLSLQLRPIRFHYTCLWGMWPQGVSLAPTFVFGKCVLHKVSVLCRNSAFYTLWHSAAKDDRRSILSQRLELNSFDEFFRFETKFSGSQMSVFPVPLSGSRSLDEVGGTRIRKGFDRRWPGVPSARPLAARRSLSSLQDVGLDDAIRAKDDYLGSDGLRAKDER